MMKMDAASKKYDVVVAIECMSVTQPECAHHDYAGSLSLPRLVNVQGDKLLLSVPPEIDNLRSTNIWRASWVSIPTNTTLDTFQGPYHHYEATFEFARFEGAICGVLFERQGQSMLVSYNWESQELVTLQGNLSDLKSVNVTKLGEEVDGKFEKHGGMLQGMEGVDTLTLRIFVDGSSIELFTSSGQVISLRMYFDEAIKNPVENLKLFSKGGKSMLVSGSAWIMSSIWDHPFHSSTTARALKHFRPSF
eukprot:TRINITY_DN2119_c2_g1_i3.p1 TRINITY_DN2119_c2_g1~~TRINITY_DN2119_c2_g1_i3.p1  ORF type:complete len:249 (-),score=49.90 TRINITY_DN2119_c2_g1_i3:56-802(-)